MPYQIVSLYYILYQRNYVPRPCYPRVILSEAAHRVWGRTRQPNSAAQRTPPLWRGASRRDLRCLNAPRNATTPPPAPEPSEAKGKILRRHPKPRLEPPSGKVPRIPKLHRKGHPKRSTYQSRTTTRVPFAVKFLESLEPSPKEGSKRGLGRRPKVFPSLTAVSSGRRGRSCIRGGRGC